VSEAIAVEASATIAPATANFGVSPFSEDTSPEVLGNGPG